MRERRAAEPRGETPPVEEKQKGRLKVRQGIVVSDKADKTITVRIDTARQHRMYKKIVRTSSTLHAHDERNEAHTGDTVPRDREPPAQPHEALAPGRRSWSEAR